MVAELLVFLLLVGGMVWHVRRRTWWIRRRMRPVPSTLPEYRTHRAAQLSEHHPEWTECPCCECPTVETTAAWRLCELCGWEADIGTEPSVLRRVRVNFVEHGSIHTPEEASTWGEAALSGEEIRLKKSLAEVCAAVRRGELGLEEWEQRWLSLRAELEDAGRRLLDHGQPSESSPSG